MASYIARRKFLATLGGAAAAWPLAARAQQQLSKIPRIGIIDPGAIGGGPLSASTTRPWLRRRSEHRH
jgi:hypothetical protein